ncbi:MAG: hypothetical protein J4F31_02360 [Flavobacteriales bacterium]|nr:hypothetical protein [Flavobacteriales bacterium]
MKALLLSLAFMAASLTTATQSDGKSETVTLTLRNKTATSIPLHIPGVMNPNLSPFSHSGVEVAVGQKFYHYPKGQKFMAPKVLLFEATRAMNGDTLVVNELIKEKRRSSEFLIGLVHGS